jgi:glycosyltransferase involved in cell wall biosynthesis
MQTDKSIAIIVACYKDAGSVPEMLKRIHAVMANVTAKYEIIYVNDASPDGAESVLADAFKKDKRLTVITHARNFGSQNVFTSGIIQSRTDAVILMDGDLQDPPEIIPEFVEKWLQGNDVVYGVRTRRKAGFALNLAYRIFYRIYQKMSYVQVPLDAGDFSLMSRQVADLLAAMPERDRFLRGLRAWVGFQQTGVPYTREARFSGESTNSLLDNVRWAKKGIFSLSFKPLEWISYLAALMVVGSLIAILVYIYLYFRVGAPSGFVTLLVVMLFLGGVQLLCFSIMAEYMGRIFEEVKGRPRFIVKRLDRHQ